MRQAKPDASKVEIVDYPQLVASGVTVRTSETHLIVGTHPDFQVRLDGFDNDAEAWLRGLDGAVSWEQQLRIAATHRVDVGVARAALIELARVHLLVSGRNSNDFEVLPPRSVAIVGSPPLARAMQRLLPKRTIGLQVTAPELLRIKGVRGHELCLAVVALAADIATRVEMLAVDQLAAADVPYLVVGAGQARMRVGPFVFPGYSACLRCEQEVNADRDPHWQAVNISLAVADPIPDRIAVEATAVETVRMVRSFADAAGGSAGLCLRAGEMHEAGCRGGPWTTKFLAQHPACGCTWSDQY